jgi:uncharacterized protein (TIGR02147 family)
MHVGLRSSGHILYVMQGKRKLTEDLALKLAPLFKISKRETEYLLQMMRYNHAKTSREKELHLQRCIAMRPKTAQWVSEERYRFYEKWYYTAIRAAVSILDINDDYSVLAKSITPPITTAQAGEAVDLLLKLGFICRNDNGILRPTAPSISTGDVWQSAYIHSFHHQVAQLGKEALDRIEKSQRDISCITLSVSNETLDLIKQRISNLRAELLEMARLDDAPDRVIHCNFQLFPVFKTKAGEK